MLELDEAAIRADERRRMDAAFNWDTSCLGCADRLDGLIAERAAGARDVLLDVERAMAEGRSVQSAVDSLWEQVGGRPESDGDARSGLADPRGRQSAPGGPQGDDPPL